MAYVVYILRTSNNRLYIGQTNQLSQRLRRHISGDGAKFLRKNIRFEIAYTEEYSTQLEAMRREKQLKGWTRAKKEALIVGNR